MKSLLDTIAEDRILNIAHRGARSLAPENTLSAALRALREGADLWELDVMMTADGEPIVIHDESLKRTSNAAQVFPSRRPWRVREFTLEEIRRLDFGSWFAKEDPFGQIAAGIVSEQDLQSYRGERAPTLDEALQFTLAHEWYVNIEIKDLWGVPGDQRIVEKVMELVEKFEMSDRVLISSFDHSYLKQVKAINPAISTGVLVERRPFNPARLVQDLQAATYHPRVSALRTDDVRLLRERGIGVLVWVANDERTMHSLIARGVNGIFTDFPQLLRPIVSGKKRS